MELILTSNVQHLFSGSFQSINMGSRRVFAAVFVAVLYCQFGLARVLPARPRSYPIPRYVCPADFVRLGNGCYYFSSHIATWQDAHFACREKEAQLVSLNTAWEDNTIRRYLSKPEFAPLERWIGGVYDWQAEQWTWGATGQRMTYNGFSEISNSRIRNWHCAYLDPVLRLQWHHKLCTHPLHYICEAPLQRLQADNVVTSVQPNLP